MHAPHSNKTQRFIHTYANASTFLNCFHPHRHATHPRDHRQLHARCLPAAKTGKAHTRRSTSTQAHSCTRDQVNYQDFDVTFTHFVSTSSFGESHATQPPSYCSPNRVYSEEGSSPHHKPEGSRSGDQPITLTGVSA